MSNTALQQIESLYVFCMSVGGAGPCAVWLCGHIPVGAGGAGIHHCSCSPCSGGTAQVPV